MLISWSYPNFRAAGQPLQWGDDPISSSSQDRSLNDAFDDSRGDGVTGEARGIMDFELVHQALAVLLDRLDARAC
jgi:hypothetical protein